MKRQGRRGGKPLLTTHMPPLMPKHMRELVRNVTDNLYRDPPIPEKFRALFDGDEKAESEDKT